MLANPTPRLVILFVLVVCAFTTVIVLSKSNDDMCICKFIDSPEFKDGTLYTGYRVNTLIQKVSTELSFPDDLSITIMDVDVAVNSYTVAELKNGATLAVKTTGKYACYIQEDSDNRIIGFIFEEFLREY